MDRLYSFVLPAYKAAFFKEAIDSILAQTYTNFELIIVNDASPEDLDSIVNNYSDSRIRYYKNEENIGGKDLVAQWNHCLEYVRGEYMILASDDDIYLPQYLEKMDALIEKYPEVNVFRPRILKIDATGRILHVDGYLNEYSSIYEYSFFLMRSIISSGVPYFIFKTKSLNANNGFVNFPLAWFSDDATVLFLGKNGIVTSKDILFQFRQSNINLSSIKNSEEIFLKQINAAKLYKDFMREFTIGWNRLSDLYANQTYDLLKSHILDKIHYILGNSSISTILRYRQKIYDVGVISQKMLYKAIIKLLYTRLK